MDGWLQTEINVLHRELNPDMVTHPSTNRARCRLTSLIKTYALPLRQTATSAVLDTKHPYIKQCSATSGTVTPLCVLHRALRHFTRNLSSEHENDALTLLLTLFSRHCKCIYVATLNKTTSSTAIHQQN